MGDSMAGRIVHLHEPQHPCAGQCEHRRSRQALQDHGAFHPKEEATVME
jgi:hypothetical protein